MALSLYCALNSAFPKEHIGTCHRGYDSDFSCVNTVIDSCVLIFSDQNLFHHFHCVSFYFKSALIYLLIIFNGMWAGKKGNSCSSCIQDTAYPDFAEITWNHTGSRERVTFDSKFEIFYLAEIGGYACLCFQGKEKKIWLVLNFLG